MAFLEGCLQYFGGVWHFWSGACNVLEGCGILEVLPVFWRGVAFWRGACSVLEGHDILEGCGILEGCLQCFGRA